MSFSLIIIASLVLIFLIFSLIKGKEKEKSRVAVIKSGKSPSKPLREEDTTVPPKVMSPYHVDEDDDIVPEDEISTINRIIKDHVEAALETMYPAQYTNPYPFVLPLENQNILPETIRIVQDRLSRLKKFRSVHEKLQLVLNDPKVQISDISKHVTSDPVLVAKILKVANSPYFGIPGKIDSISHALMILGIVNIKNILYREGLLQLFLTNDPEKNKVMEKIWEHATLTSICAAQLHYLFGGLNRGSLFTMGLLHDIGKLILLMMPTHAENDRQESYSGYSKLDQEDRLFGINHAVIAGIALSEWGFSDLMVNVVANHHGLAYKNRDSLKVDSGQLPYLFVLFVADQVAKRIGGDEDLVVDILHPSYHQEIDRRQLQGLLQENIFLSQIRESGALSVCLPAGGISSAVDFFREGTPNNQENGLTDSTLALDSSKAKTNIGRYEILKVIGQGAMGTVYLGRDPLIQRTVAIKSMRYGNGDDIAMSRTRFFREAEAAGGLSHPNIVTIYDVGEDRGTAYIAMEYLDGCDLSSHCGRVDLLPHTEVSRIARDVALALNYAHERGVIHRDIKPANIRISSAGHVKVTDFGIARLSDLSCTYAGTILGTPNYMSPEQISGEIVDGRADLFSLGIVLYELLTGYKPFKGDSIAAVMNSITNNIAIPVREKVPGIPEQLAIIVEKAIQKDREGRYQSGREMAGGLDALLNVRALTENF